MVPVRHRAESCHERRRGQAVPRTPRHWLFVVATTAATLLSAACSGGDGRPATGTGSPSGAGTAAPTASWSPPGSGAGPSTEAFPSTPRPTDGAGVTISETDLRKLKKGDCVTTAGPPAETGCGSPDAVARVLDTGWDTGALSRAVTRACPVDTDYPVQVSAEPARTPGGGPGPGAHPPLEIRPSIGYACLRNLRGPHPGRPGEGGGVLTIGDCVNDDSGSPIEVACDAGGGRRAEYKVTGIEELVLGERCRRGNGRIAFKPRGEYIREYCARTLS